MLCANGRPVVQRDFEEDELDDDHETGLEKERIAVVCAEPVEDSVDRSQHIRPTCPLVHCPYLSIEATSMMRGMSREKPSLLFDRWIEKIWSA